MMNEDNLPAKGQFLVYQAEDGTVKIDVRLEDETVWLTQPLMAKLFQTTQQNISQHLLNVYEEGEVVLEATHKKFLSVRREGNRDVRRNLDFYNLDMIISVGYRVKSHVATRFRALTTQATTYGQKQKGRISRGAAEHAGSFVRLSLRPPRLCARFFGQSKGQATFLDRTKVVCPPFDSLRGTGGWGGRSPWPEACSYQTLVPPGRAR